MSIFTKLLRRLGWIRLSNYNLRLTADNRIARILPLPPSHHAHLSGNAYASPLPMPVLRPLPAVPVPSFCFWEEEEETDEEWYHQVNRGRLADTGTNKVLMEFSDQEQTRIELVSPHRGVPSTPSDTADTWQHEISGIPMQPAPDETTFVEIQSLRHRALNKIKSLEKRGRKVRLSRDEEPEPPTLAFP